MSRLVAIAALFASLPVQALAQQKPLAPFPSNPRYWLWRGSVRALVGAGEHYGAVVNMDFNTTTYVNTLLTEGLSLVRVWTGATYIEPANWDNMPNNTFAPAPGRFLAPWAVTTQCCYNNTPGVGRFNLSDWNPAYWARWHAFMNATSQAGIVVNVGLFGIFYNDVVWQLSPLYPGNNVNGIGANISAANDVYKLVHPEVQALLEAFALRFVSELDAYDNWFAEFINEMYVPENPAPFYPWVQRMAQVLSSAPVSNAHTLSHNYANIAARVAPVHPAIAYYSFHYMLPENVAINAKLGLPVGTEETGFAGTGDVAYRTAAWLTLLAGAGSYQNLDYSFTVAAPDGTALPLPSNAPGGGGPTLRASLALLNRILQSVDLSTAGPAPTAIVAVNVAPQGEAFKFGALSDAGGAAFFLVYVCGLSAGATRIGVSVATGAANAAWNATVFDPTAATVNDTLTVSGDATGVVDVSDMPAGFDVALLLRRAP